MDSLLLLGAAIAIEPLPIIAFILVLSTERGTRKGAAFIVGWAACLVVVVVGTLLLTGGSPPKSSSAPAVAALVATLVIGGGLLGYAVYRYRRPDDGTPSSPSWMARLDDLRLTGAATLGVLVQPWPLIAAGAAIVTEADASQVASVIVLILFGLLATSVIGAMEIYSVMSPEAAAPRLADLHSWLDRHRSQAITVVSAVLGLYLISKSLIGLVRNG